MTEAEWLACTNPVPMVEFVQERVSKRKWALYRCAGCRHITHLFYDPKSLRVIEVLERYVDGKADPVEMDNATYFAESPTFGYAFEESFWARYPDEDREILRTLVTMGALSESALSGGEWRVNEAVQKKLDAAAHLAYGCSGCVSRCIPQVEWPGPWLCHCIFGNPFRQTPTLSQSLLNWNDGTVRRIASAIYEERAFDRMPILHDALIDAGCHDEAILAHCRGEEPHVRGCWVIDLILGKE